MINRRWHQAHEERHLQRCDDKQQPNDQEHQQRSTSSSMNRSTRANYKQQLEGKQQLAWTISATKQQRIFKNSTAPCLLAGHALSLA